MKAVYQTKYGKSEVLQYGEQSTPNIKPDEVLIDNHASSVNPRDWMIRSGRYQLQFLVPSFPLILGSDLAGDVIAVGAKVSGFKVGDRVFGMKNPSEGLASYAEKVAVSERNIALIPEGLSYLDAGGIPLCSLTAWQALVDKAAIKAGMEVMVIGASGGVGSYGVQIAHALGANVTAVCSAASSEMVTELGANKVIDYHQEDFTQSPESYDLIFDTIGRHSLSRCSKVLKSGGTYVSTVPSPKNLKAMATTKLASFFSAKNQKASVVMVKASGTDLGKIARLLASKEIKPVVDRVFPIQDVAKAHDYSRSLRAKGKIVLQIQ